MKIVVSTYRTWELAVRRWRAWFYRHAWRSAVVTILMLSLIEPLGCLAHCQLWLSFRGTSVATGQQAHHHNHSAGFAQDRATVFADSRVTTPDRSTSDAAPLAATLGAASDRHITVASAQGACFLSGAPDLPWRSTNESSSASPHEHLAALIIFTCVVLVLLVRYVSRGSPPAALLPAYRPPLRPPITLAA